MLLFTLLVTALMAAGADHALAAESVTVTPSTGLHDGQAVRVQAAGYTPGKQLSVTECSAVKGASASDCDVSSAHLVSADSEGRVDVTVPVRAGPFGLDHVRCDAPPGCIVSVSDLSLSPTELATAPLQFVAGASSRPGEPGPSSGGFEPSVLLLLVPVLIGGASAAALLRWRGPGGNLAMVSGSVLLIGTATAQVYVLLTAAGAASGVNAASQYAAWDLTTDAVGAAAVAAGLALRLDPASSGRRLAVGVLAVLLVPAGMLLILPALSTLASGPQNEGGGAIWYGAAACAVGAIAAALAQLVALRRR